MSTLREPNLVFLISQPRSGSTLLQAILSQSPDISTASEHWLQLPFISFYKPELINATYNYHMATDATKDYLIKAKSKPSFDQDLKEFLLKQYHSEGQLGSYVIDKTPRYYEILPELKGLFKEAKFIILRRNPVAVLKSIMDTWKEYDPAKLAQGYARDIFVAPFEIQKFKAKHINDRNVFDLSFEDMTNSPKTVISNLFNWLGLEFQDQFLDYSKDSSFKGKYGDPTGVHQSNTIARSEKLDLQDSILGHRRSKILKGYGAYLGEEFLKAYGPYEYLSIYKNTLRFQMMKTLQYDKKQGVWDAIKMTIVGKMANS